MTRTLLPTVLLLAGLASATRLSAQQPNEVFQPGDVIRLEVEGDSLLNGTFTVGPGPAVVLPVIGNIQLGGVRRVDVEAHMQAELNRYLKSPVIHAKALIRLSIVGAVGKPGIYAVPTDLVLADAVMLAGGPTQQAKFTAMRIERGNERIVEGNRLQEALARGLTVDALNLRAGDRLYVPVENSGHTWQLVLGVLVALPTAIYAIERVH